MSGFGHGSKYCFGTRPTDRDLKREEAKKADAPQPEPMSANPEHQPIAGNTKTSAIA